MTSTNPKSPVVRAADQYYAADAALDGVLSAGSLQEIGTAVTKVDRAAKRLAAAVPLTQLDHAIKTRRSLALATVLRDDCKDPAIFDELITNLEATIRGIMALRLVGKRQQ